MGKTSRAPELAGHSPWAACALGALTAFALSNVPLVAGAQTAALWVGTGTNNNWTTADNWLPAVVPSAQTVAEFNDAADVNIPAGPAVTALGVKVTGGHVNISGPGTLSLGGAQTAVDNFVIDASADGGLTINCGLANPNIF